MPSNEALERSLGTQRVSKAMRTQKALFFVLIGLFCGCASEHFKRGRGDVGQFIVQQAVARCGLSASTNGLSPLHGRWRYFEDDKGVVIRMSPAQYPVIESLLRQAFGEPKFGPTDTKDGGKFGVYRPKGGTIQFGCDAECTQVSIIRQLTQEEIVETLQKAMQDKRFWEYQSK
jgi:hypothetical protein